MGYLGAFLEVIKFFQAADAADASAQQAKESKEMAAKYALEKMEIAAQIQDRADLLHEIWATYYLPCELATLNEICNEPIAVANIGVVAQRAVAEMIKIFTTTKKAQSYCISPQQVGTRLEMAVTTSVRQADMTSGLVRIAVQTEEARVNLLNAQRMADRINIINPGRGYDADTISALEAANTLYTGLAKEEAKTIEDSYKAMGRGIAMAVSSASDIYSSMPSGGNTKTSKLMSGANESESIANNSTLFQSVGQQGYRYTEPSIAAQNTGGGG